MLFLCCYYYFFFLALKVSLQLRTLLFFFCLNRCLSNFFCKTFWLMSLCKIDSETEYHKKETHTESKKKGNNSDSIETAVNVVINSRNWPKKVDYLCCMCMYSFAWIASRTLPRIASFFLPYEMMQIIVSTKSVGCQSAAHIFFQIECKLALQFFQWLMHSLFKALFKIYVTHCFVFASLIPLIFRSRIWWWECLIIFQWLCEYVFYLGHYDCNHSQNILRVCALLTTTTVLTRLNNWFGDFHLCAVIIGTYSEPFLLVFFNWIDYWWTMLIYDSYSTIILATC